MSNLKIFPSLISGDLLNLEQQIKQLEPHCAGFHLDVMDFHFVPNLTWGTQFVNAIREITTKQIWVDLLVDHPEYYLEKLALHHNDIVSIHYESNYPETIFNSIKQMGLQVSLALDPKTPLEVIEPFIKKIDQVLLMSVKPGFSGQAFIPRSVERVKQLNTFRKQHNAQFTIAMDGGLNEKTLPLVLPYGLDMVGIASGIFDHNDPIKALELLQAISTTK
jgi:ribulose-phosphate 3-epimerase